MKTSEKKFKTVLVPIGHGTECENALLLAKTIAKEIVLVGVVHITSGGSVSAGAGQARAIRKRLFSLRSPAIRYKSTVIVSEKPWADLLKVVANEKIDLMVTEWVDGKTACGISDVELLSNTPCDVVVIRGARETKFNRTLIAMRGGPFTELALKVGMRVKPSALDVLHLSLGDTRDEASFAGMKRVLRNIPKAKLRSVETRDVVQTILEQSKNYDVVISGVSAIKRNGLPNIGPVAETLLKESPAAVIVVKTHRTIDESKFDAASGAQAISILVDQWFAENTFHSTEFSDMAHLMELKKQRKVTISLALPSLNEEKTLPKLISTVKNALMTEVRLLDEIVLIDSSSIDRSREIARELGIPVYIHQELLPELGPRSGKGEALWKSLLVTKGDIIVWIDTDIVNIHPRFVYGIIGPLLLDPDIKLVKGFYRRPLREGSTVTVGGGGRVTELTARPLLNLFYPELSGVIQPLAGEYAARREVLESVPFFSGYGVETGLIIDIFEKYGLSSIAQVDLLERIHHNQDLEALGKMSFAILQAVLRRLETRYERSIVEDVNKTMKLIRYNRGGYFLDVEYVAELERPPMNSIQAYKERAKK